VNDLASNGTPMDVLTDQDWETEYGLVKFDTVAAEKIHSWTLDSSQTDECGNSVDWLWWAAKFDGADGQDMGAGVILTEMSGGSVTAARYESAAEYNAAWFNIEDQWLTAVHADCTDGKDCEGCQNCENF
jgi:hypothetical protein